MRVFPEGGDEASDLIVAKAVGRRRSQYRRHKFKSQFPGGIRDNDNCYSSAVGICESGAALWWPRWRNEGDANSTYSSDYGLLLHLGDLKNVLFGRAADKDGNVADFSSVGSLSDLSFGEKVYARGGCAFGRQRGLFKIVGNLIRRSKVSSAAALVMQRLKNIGMSGAELCDNTIALLENTSRPIADKRVTMSGIHKCQERLKKQGDSDL